MPQPHLQKRHRDLLHHLQPLMDELGVTLTGMSIRGSGHWRLQFDLGHGATGHLIVANSPSGPRHYAQNTSRSLRRLVEKSRKAS